MTTSTRKIMEELADREAIRECLYRYSRGVDRLDADMLRSAYWPDAVDNHLSFTGNADSSKRKWGDKDKPADKIIPASSGQFSAARNSDGTLKAYRRRPEKWFSKTYYHEVQRVKELYVELFNNEIPVSISDALTAQITLAA